MAKPDWRCGAARDLPIDRASAWDGPAAAKRMLDAAGIGTASPRPETAKRGFLLYDAANPNLRGSYKLPFADHHDGRLAAVEGGIRAAASRLPDTDAPQREKDRARQILDHYEKRMAEDDKKSGARGLTSIRRPHAAHQLPFLAQRMFNTPLALHPAKAEMIMTALAERLGITHLLRPGGQTVALAEVEAAEPDQAEPRAYDVMNGIAIIPVVGTLVHKLGTLRPMSGMTGYDGIRACLAQALDDAAVRGIAFAIDSPGGEVCGCFDLADAIFGARGRKPMWSILDEVAYSAAYAIASATDWVVVPRTGGVGSIGVIALFADVSKALETGGVTVNVIQFGARKADGLETTPLSSEARDRFQADVNTMGTLFVETVARNRKLATGKVVATEAATFLGAAGVAQGFADAVGAPDAAFRAFLKSL